MKVEFCILLALTGVLGSGDARVSTDRHDDDMTNGGLEVSTGALTNDGLEVLTDALASHDELVEGRGKAKYALLMHFFYVVATKLFVLKIVYGAIFYALIIKGWHFVSWFIHYLKEKKHKPYVPYGPVSYGHHYGHDLYDHGHYEHENYGHDHYGLEHFEPENYGQDYVSDSYSSYAFDQKRHDSKKAYDADGSYSVKS